MVHPKCIKLLHSRNILHIPNINLMEATLIHLIMPNLHLLRCIILITILILLRFMDLI